MDPVYLKDYKPTSKLKVKSHTVDRAKFPTIDCHGHFADFFCGIYAGDGGWVKPDIPRIVEAFQGYNIQKVVNLDGFWHGFLDMSLEDILVPFREYPDFFINFVSIYTELAKKPGFDQYIRQHLTQAKELGVRGVKLFKLTSLYVETGPYQFEPGLNISIDDDRLSPIWKTAAELDMPVLVHIGDPEAFFDPVDKHNERYLSLLRNPEWAYYGKGTYSFEELMQAQKNLLSKNPDTTFIVAHVGSNAENLAFVSECLDAYPNMYVDLAARFDELGRQPYTAREFFIKYQDRILFGTDVYTHNLGYVYDLPFRFLETFDEYITGGFWPTYGIGLEDDIRKKIYHDNAAKILGF